MTAPELKPCTCGKIPEIIDNRTSFFVQCKNHDAPWPTIFGQSVSFLDNMTGFDTHEEADRAGKAAFDAVNWKAIRKSAVDAWNNSILHQDAIDAAVKAEREACAATVESLWAYRTCRDVVDAIRARGEDKP